MSTRPVASQANSNVVDAVTKYITRMVDEQKGHKILLLDEETIGIISMVYSISRIMEHEVFLIEPLKKEREKLGHLKALCFLRPTKENVELLCRELNNPLYPEYYIYFTNALEHRKLQDLAESDSHEVIRQVQEFFCDFYPVSPDLFSLNIPTCITHNDAAQDVRIIARICDGIGSSILAFKRKPSIRYSRTSELAERVARELVRRINADSELYDFKKTDSVYLIVDRRQDPITPLLNQWTYQAMLHELLEIQNNRISLAHITGIQAELKEAVVSTEDKFFMSNIYSNFGDLAMNVKSLMDEFQSKSPNQEQIKSIEDMMRLVKDLPEFKKQSSHVTKHVTLTSELSRLVHLNKLFEVSELEQDIACAQVQTGIYDRICAQIRNPDLPPYEKLRLVLLYAIRNETAVANIRDLIELLRDAGLSADLIEHVHGVLVYAGQKVRGAEVSAGKSYLGIAKKIIQREIKGVSNVYTQHQPAIMDTIDALSNSRLPDAAYPYAIGPYQQSFSEVVVFFVGGATYEEAKAIAAFNETSKGLRVILGGTTIHNSSR
eukprot:TRINITY_DN3567_c0_g3_i7.p1 TRINITY_DN3567_c0_g3~~TRINITY_DN3567_c0_g3_i7.p1  ORF type:complete len:549 (-),score=130.31 TRINITY_DN3567_c0_g3_i7:1374-3020(-)